MASSSYCPPTKYPYPSQVNVGNFVSIKLSRTNYTKWKPAILRLIETYGLVGFINGKVPAPRERITVPDVSSEYGTKKIVNYDYNSSDEGIISQDYQDWKRSDQLLREWILGTLGEDILPDVVELNTAKSIWTTLQRKLSHPFMLDTDIEFDESQVGMNVNHHLPLYKAAVAGDWESAGKYLAEKPEAEHDNITGTSETALMIAVRSSRGIDFVKKILDRSIEQDHAHSRDSFGQTALHVAAEAGNIEAAKLLLDSIFSRSMLYSWDSRTMTPIHLAARCGRMEMVLLLMEYIKKHRSDDLKRLELEAAETVERSQTELNSPALLDDEPGVRLVHDLISFGHYDVALSVLKEYPNLSSVDLCPLQAIALKRCAFQNGTGLKFWQRLIYYFVPIKLENVASNHTGGGIKKPAGDGRGGDIENPAGDSTEGSVENSVGGGTGGDLENPASGVTKGGVENPASGGTGGDIENPPGGSTRGDIENPVGGSTEGGVENPANGSIGGDIENPVGGGIEGGVENPAGRGTGGDIENPTGGGTEGGVENHASGGTGGDIKNHAGGGTEGDIENPAGGSTEGSIENPAGGSTRGDIENPVGGGTEGGVENSVGGGTGGDIENPAGGGIEDGVENPVDGGTGGGLENSIGSDRDEVSTEIVAISVESPASGDTGGVMENPTGGGTRGGVENPTSGFLCEMSKIFIFPLRICHVRGRKKLEEVFDEVRCKLQKLRAVFWNGIEIVVPQIKDIRSTTTRHHQALDLVKYLCKKVAERDLSDPFTALRPALMLAAGVGNHKVVEEIFDSFPSAVYLSNEMRKTVFHVAITNRQENVFNLIHQFNKELRHKFVMTSDIWRNNCLHLAGCLDSEQKLKIRASAAGAALQMQRELQWFKEVEKLTLPYGIEQRNNEGKTPAMIFTETHEDLVKEGERWMKDTASSCTIVAALIATVVFAAAITVPGGNNSSGLPIFFKKKVFRIFAVSDAIALFSATSSLLMFLSIFTSRYSQEDFLYALPKRLIIGLVTLFLSITSMMVAFGTTIYLVFGVEDPWILFSLVAWASIPATLFVFLQFPLLWDMIKSTYGPSIFHKQSNRILF